jgi:crotonobetainyl-CoA:carnitine CoA-transferase CaiB-like acyl-CoA transferase
VGRNVRGLEEEISAALGTRKADEMLARLESAGIPAGRIRTLPEVCAWEQVRHLGLVHEMDHVTLGPIAVPGSPLRFDGVPADTPVPPPVLGQHETTDEEGPA